MIEDGAQAVYSARYEIDATQKRLRVISENHNGFVMQHFYITSAEDCAEGIYDAEKFIIDESYANLEGGVYQLNGVPSYTWETMFTHYHNENYVYPCGGLRGEMTGLNLRVIYKNEKTAVFYSCATYKSAPYTVESFTVVSLEVEAKENEDTQAYVGSDIDFPTRSNKSEKCYRCNDGWRECKVCDGMGYREFRYDGQYYGNYQNRDTVKKCSNCQGGKVKCSTCGGDSEI